MTSVQVLPSPSLGEHTSLLPTSPPSVPSSLAFALPAPQHVAEHLPHYAAIQRPTSPDTLRSKPSSKDPKYHHGGQSTFAQTLLNAVAVLFGIGMLSQPLAFACAGWIGGSILIIGYGLLSCYTAKILTRIVLDDPHIRSFADIGRKAFGPRSMPLINVIFALELFTVTVGLVTLYADSLYALLPAYSSATYKILGIVVLIPVVLMPLTVLSYASFTGIFILMGLIGIILFDGFTKFDSPGSLWVPADTSPWISDYQGLGIAFGLFMAGFSSHAVIPTLAKDMIDPSRCDEMIHWAFAIATGTYSLLGVAGYLMFGNSVSDEFSVDLMKYNVHPALNTLALWGLVITPLTKYALSSRPISLTIEIFLGIDTTGASLGEHDAPVTTAPHKHMHGKMWKSALVAFERTLLTLCSIGVSIAIPEFASIMAVLGSTFSFLLCIIGPLAAKIALDGGVRKCGWGDGCLLVASVAMAVWGTICAFQIAKPEIP